MFHVKRLVFILFSEFLFGSVFLYKHSRWIWFTVYGIWYYGSFTFLGRYASVHISVSVGDATVAENNLAVGHGGKVAVVGDYHECQVVLVSQTEKELMKLAGM